MQARPTLLARQPIYDASLEVVAFELLYRPTLLDTATIDDGDEASSRVLLTAFASNDILDVAGGKPVFINFTANLIANPPPIDPQHLVVEVLEDVAVTPEVLQGVQRLRRQGYRIALDDFQHHPTLAPLVELADIIKLDVLDLGEVRLRAEVRQLRNYPARLLAEKIESWEVFNHCVDLGFSYFQGYFLARPQLVHGRRMVPARIAVTAVMRQIMQPDIDIAALAAAIGSDPMLSFNLIKLVNSSAYRRATPVESLRDAIFVLGVERVRGWCYLMLLSRLDGKPGELKRIALTRARFCELLGQRVDHAMAPRCFTMGVLSSLDAFLDERLGDIIATMTLSEELSRALLAHHGAMGAILGTALAFETASWTQAPWQELHRLGVDQELVEALYLESLLWVNTMLGEMRRQMPGRVS